MVEIEGTSGKVDCEGVKRETSFLMLPDVKVGDYVILHAGFAIKKLSEADAKETLRIIQEMVRVEKGLDV